ncbi:hypothetical protein EC957_009078 [Mortierella hygrophila]|uniref:Uncharacterized protein n=1 Tax=Mortierella hygrophila TaxID=979708 RepID=A0A9P6K5A1_9FUNG|nr:hypothetical protein EC957_009078 [Mortierella hygrophila]
MSARENEQSEPEIDRDSVVSHANSDRGNTNINSPDTIESPLTAQHPHIIYSTVPATTTTPSFLSLASSSTKATRTNTTSTATASAATTTSASESKSETLDLDLGPTQGLCSPATFSAQLDSLAVDNMTNLTSSLAQDTLHLRGEINFDDSQEPRPHLDQWTPSLRGQNASHTDNGSNASKADGLRFKDHPIDTIVRGMGRERKRSTNVAYDGTSSDRKRRKNLPDWGLKQSSSTVTTTSTETAAHLLRFLERRLDQRYPNSTSLCSASKQSSKSLFKQNTSLDFDPLHLLHSWSAPSPHNVSVVQSTTTPVSPTSSSASSSSRRRRLVGHKQPYHNSLDCRQQHASPEKCQCRKRGFAEAIELSRPFTMNADIASHHPNWIESIKKRKVHQNATKWTSALSPAPYVRLLTLRNFWEMMEPRQDLSWRAGDDTRFGQDESEEEEVEDVEDGKAEMESAQMETESAVRYAGQKSPGRNPQQPSCVRIVKQYPCPGHFLRGLWEEELRNQRVRQMIPDTVRKPVRGKIYHAKPIATMIKQNKPSLLSLLSEPLSSGPNSPAPAVGGGLDDSTAESKDEACEAAQEASSISSTTELEVSLKKKHRAAAIIRSHAITEGSDMSEYKPWKDGTVTPRQGSLQALKASRSNIMDPWPVEEAKSKDECMRVLHRMREQLNIVINLQIHLRSMMKTAPAQWSFLLSIRHPGQVSIELLLALYGPHFMQSSNFRAIEELLWGAKGHSQQTTPSIDAASSSSPALVQT